MKRIISPMFIVFLVLMAVGILFETSTAFICATMVFCTDIITLTISNSHGE